MPEQRRMGTTNFSERKKNWELFLNRIDPLLLWAQVKEISKQLTKLNSLLQKCFYTFEEP